jgi:hypothetical protein
VRRPRRRRGDQRKRCEKDGSDRSEHAGTVATVP